MRLRRWYAKRFLHPSVVAPYDYIFLWDEDLSIEAFDAEEYLKIARKHGLEISQPGLDITRGPKPFFDITVRRNGSEMHKYVFSTIWLLITYSVLAMDPSK